MDGFFRAALPPVAFVFSVRSFHATTEEEGGHQDQENGTHAMSFLG
jgi:hypothetical protein